MAKWWANIGAVKVSYTVTFFGITPSSKEIMFHGSDGITRIDLKSSLHLEEAQPEAKLKYSVCTGCLNNKREFLRLCSSELCG